MVLITNQGAAFLYFGSPHLGQQLDTLPKHLEPQGKDMSSVKNIQPSHGVHEETKTQGEPGPHCMFLTLLALGPSLLTVELEHNPIPLGSFLSLIPGILVSPLPR